MSRDFVAVMATIVLVVVVMIVLEIRIVANRNVGCRIRLGQI